MNPLPLLLTADEVAQQLRVTRFRVYELARRGDLPAVKLGRTLRFSQTTLREWIDRGGTLQESPLSERRDHT